MEESSGFPRVAPAAHDTRLERWKEKYPPCTRLEIAEVMRRFDDPEEVDVELRRRMARYLGQR